MDFNKPFTYNSHFGRWELELRKAQKDMFAQCGLKISIDSGFPTGETGAIYQTKEPSGLKGVNIKFHAFDNLSGWTSAISFDLPTLLEKLIEIMPEDKFKCETFVLAQRDLETIEKQKGEQK